MDEIYTLNITDPHLSYDEFLNSVLQTEGFPYLYYVVLKLLYVMLGYSAFTARLLSSVAGIGAIYMIYVFGKDIFNKKVGLFAAFLLSINIYHIQYSQEARSYSLYCLFVIIAFYKFSVFFRNPTIKNAIWYGVAGGILLNISFFSVFNLLAQVILILLLLSYSPKEQRKSLLKLSTLSGIIAVLLFLPNYKILLNLFTLKSFWIPRPEAETYTIILRELLGSTEITMFLYEVIFVFYLLYIYRKNIYNITPDSVKDNPAIYSFIILFTWFMSFFGLMYLKSYIGPSLAISRYFISILPVCMLVLALGIYAIKNSILRIGIIVSVLFFSLVNIVVARSFYTGVYKSQYRETAAFIEQNNKRGANVYTSLKYMFDFYLDNEKIKTNLEERNLEDHVNLMLTDSTQRKSFWYADAHGRPLKISENAQNYLQKYFVVENNFDGFDAWTKYYMLKTESPTPKINITKYLPLQPFNGDKVYLNPEVTEFNDNMVTATGWIYFEGQEAKDTRIYGLLISDDNKLHFLQTQKLDRPDLTSAKKEFGYNLDNCGYTIKDDISSIPPCNYKFALYLINKTTGKEALVVTDKAYKK